MRERVCVFVCECVDVHEQVRKGEEGSGQGHAGPSPHHIATTQYTATTTTTTTVPKRFFAPPIAQTLTGL